MHYLLIKRFFDFTFAFLAIGCLGPFILILALLVWVVDGLPIWFIQVRPGFQAKDFKLIKFRTMKVEPNKGDETQPDLHRISPLGHFLRASHLDELPQLINILKGEMSFVGPRPLLKSYLPHYTSEQQKRHLVKPGLTGWAQLHYTPDMDWVSYFKYDMFYIEHLGWKLDLIILLRTLAKITKKESQKPKKGYTRQPFAKN